MILINQTPLKSPKNLLFSALLFLMLIGVAINEAYSSELVGEGTTDTIRQENNKIVADGWVGAGKPNQMVTSLSVWLADKKYKGLVFIKSAGGWV